MNGASSNLYFIIKPSEHHEWLNIYYNENKQQMPHILLAINNKNNSHSTLLAHLWSLRLITNILPHSNLSGQTEYIRKAHIKEKKGFYMLLTWKLFHLQNKHLWDDFQLPPLKCVPLRSQMIKQYPVMKSIPYKAVLHLLLIWFQRIIQKCKHPTHFKTTVS
jgi:hypothetical protein